MKQVIPRLGSFKIPEITPEDIGKMMSKIKDKSRRGQMGKPSAWAFAVSDGVPAA